MVLKVEATVKTVRSIDQTVKINTPYIDEILVDNKAIKLLPEDALRHSYKLLTLRKNIILP